MSGSLYLSSSIVIATYRMAYQGYENLSLSLPLLFPFTNSTCVCILATAEPEIQQLPDVAAAPALKHLNKERPKRAKKQMARRPVPAANIDTDAVESAEVEDFFKPATVSQTPVVVTTPAAKPRSGSKSDKLDDR